MPATRHPLVPSTRARRACILRRPWRAAAVSAAVSAAAAAAVVLGTAPARAQAVPALASGAPAWAALCRAELSRPAEVERAAAEFARAFPFAGWHEVLVTELPLEVPGPVRASVVARRGVDPLIYWRAPIPGAVLLHELTHAWQAALPDDAFDALLAALAARDRAAGFDARLVEQATTSVAFGVTAAFADQRSAAQLGARLLARARVVPADRPGALTARAAVLTELFAGPEWREVRAALARGRGGDARGRAWDAWLRALFLLEVQAYDAQVHCVAGGTADREDGVPTTASEH